MKKVNRTADDCIRDDGAVETGMDDIVVGIWWNRRVEKGRTEG